MIDLMIGMLIVITSFVVGFTIFISFSIGMAYALNNVNNKKEKNDVKLP